MPTTATATAWIAELHAARRPTASPRRAQAVGAATNLGGIGMGPLIAGFIAFAGLALFNSLAPTFLDGPLHHPSLALVGAAAFIAFAAAAAVQLSTPSLWLFLAGGVVLGAGVGAYFKGSLGTVIALSDPSTRAGALTVFFLIGYIGLSIPAVGLGLLSQHVADKTALLIFGAMLVTGIAASAGFLIRGTE